jgi:hypothetical protein
MKAIIQSIFFIVFLIMTKPGICQRDTIIYTGVNGRLTSEDSADTRKEILYQASSKIEIISSRKQEKKWQVTQKELITIEKENIFRVVNENEKKSTPVVRHYDRRQDGSFLFREYSNKNLIREGKTLQLFPIILDGECVEYYENGKLKSRSVYARNELVSNLNWLENGDKYIDSVFYSVDEEPLLTGGDAKIRQHVLQAFRNTGLNFSSVSGSLILGFVVMESGEIKGVRVMKSMGDQINKIAVFALQTLIGKWTPASLHGKPVRYFQLYPINFIVRESTFQYMEFNGSMIYYNTNW